MSTICIALLYTLCAIAQDYHGLHHNQVTQMVMVYAVVRNSTVRLLAMVWCMWVKTG